MRASMLGTLVILGAVGCANDGGFTTTGEAPGPVSPSILVTPVALDFGAQLPETEHSQRVTVQNVGEETLVVDAIELISPAFWIEPPILPLVLESGMSAPLDVFYVPSQPSDQGVLSLESNDPLNEKVDVVASGGALRSGLEVTPNPLEFGTVAQPCSEDGVLEFINSGGAPVTITALTVSGGAFELDALAPALPWTLDAASASAVRMWFTPDGFSTEGSLRVMSDDPAGPITVQLLGQEEPPPRRVEEFKQLPNSWPAVDIVFTVDRSGSMDDDAARLGASYEALKELLAESDLDFHVMVATRDSGCHNEAIIEADIAGSEVLFDAACRGPGGDRTEAGVQILEAAMEETGLGGCNSGFLREEANHLAVLLSDEPEQSLRGWRSHLDGVLAIVPDMIVNVVVGPPGGGGCAEEGYGYHDAADATGGAKLNLCSADWVDYFEEILSTSVNEAEDTFVLKGEPLEETLEVTVNGFEVYDWTYDAELNAIVFGPSSIPQPDAVIVVEYDEAAEC